jgi:hypothetical protein
MPFRVKFEGREHPDLSLEKFFGNQCQVTRSDPVGARKTPFAPYQGDNVFLVVSGKYNLGLYFEPGTKEHECLRKVFARLHTMEILQPAPLLPSLELVEQVVDLTSAVVKLSSTVAGMESEIEQMKHRNAEIESDSGWLKADNAGLRARIEKLENRLESLQYRDKSPNRK